MSSITEKPLGRKAYGSIPHLPNSRKGPGDHHCEPGQARICTERVRDKHDFVIVTEKLDGSCMAVARIDGTIHPLNRSGWPASSSPREQHQLFHIWVMERQQLFLDILEDGERLVGEWLAQAHGTRYELRGREPFLVFDLIIEGERQPYVELIRRTPMLRHPATIHTGRPLSVESAMRLVRNGSCDAIDPVEGAVWRVERYGQFDFMCKYVRSEKIDGLYLPEISGKDPVWNWRP